MYNVVNYQKLKMTNVQQLMVANGKSCEFLFLYCFIFLQVMNFLESLLTTMFNLCMVFLMIEVCVVWRCWVDFHC